MSNTQIQTQAQSVHVPKTLGHHYDPQANQSTAKALGSDPALAQWYQEAYAYYQNVASGQSPQPDTASWNEFLTQMNWAYQQLSYASQGAQSFDFLDSGSGVDNSQAADPFGGLLGTNGNWIHNNAEAQMGFLGGYSREVWSNEITYDVAPLSAHTQVVKTMDTSVQPPVEVIKIKTMDPATGTEDVITIHDWEDADITIRAGDPSSVTGADALGITVEEFKEGNSAPAVQQSSIPGEAHAELDNYWIYEARVGETIEFRPEPSGEGDVEYHEIYGDFRIVGRTSDHFVVSKGMPGEPDGYTVEVRHRDGSKDIFYVNKGGFQGEIAGNPAYITWADGTQSAEDIAAGVYEGVEEGVPAEFEDVFSLRIPGQVTSSEEEVNFGGTAPDDIEEREVEFSGVTETHKTAIYNNPENQDVTIQVNHGDDVTTHEVYAPGVVTINPESYQDTIRVEKTGESTYRVFVAKDGKSEIIIITGAEKIILNGLEANVNLAGLPEEDQVVTMGTSGTTRATQEPEASEVDLPDYPENVSSMVRGDHHDQLGRQLAEEIELALHTGDWSGVQTMLAGVTDNGTGNDMVRHYLSALYRAMVGSSSIDQNSRNLDEDGLKKVLQNIPTDVRRTLINYLYHEEGNERRGNEIWGNVQARQILVASITEQEFSETGSADDE